MRGFKKDGKFRPTEKQSSGISSSQIRSKKSVIPSTGKASEIREKKHMDKKKNLSLQDLEKLNRLVKSGVDEDLALHHFITEIQPINGFVFSKYPPINEKDKGSDIESTSYSVLEKGDRNNGSKITLRKRDGRLGGGYDVYAEVFKNGNYARVDLPISKKYDNAINGLKNLMSIL